MANLFFTGKANPNLGSHNHSIHAIRLDVNSFPNLTRFAKAFPPTDQTLATSTAQSISTNPPVAETKIPDKPKKLLDIFGITWQQRTMNVLMIYCGIRSAYVLSKFLF